ncbi:hypothetical protein PILCRDRAFT_94931 [Piloderma croceum F 1598]|uniref:Sugar phosphate transporter domain-containing protein n=1 Tax=Piloderma croceum (strain F 1598) TaxID=765440 RepID=A0A0C3GIY2_PILCF|nr:hypothetical protein PILCRDRAFT_94931 [Piloderma croceum F 1598]
MSPVNLSHLKKLLSKYWSSADSSLSTRTSRRATPISSDPTTRFILLCSLWYTTSALSSNTGKAILTQFRYPVTLTFVQFGFVALYCLLFMSPSVRFSKLRPPTKEIIRSTLPMGMFQVGGHMFSSMAISRIPVSTVHTIKALSPLFTVAAYALLFGVSYSAKTYLSLLPLTVGVMLACTFDVSASNTTGLLCAFGSALVFVSSNIFFKKIMPSPSKANNHPQSAHKLDKLNLLFYSSSMAFLLMIPIWLYYDLPAFLSPLTLVAHPSHGHANPHSVTYYVFMNGTVHFAQNIIAFVILSSTSPVTYSIASLIKRVAVICIAIVWFSQSVHPVQGFGIGMTFFGLWMYNNAKGDVERGENKMRRVEAARDLMLPSTNAEDKMMSGMDTPRSPLHHSPLHPPPFPTIQPPTPPAPNHSHPNLHMKLPPLPPTTILIPKRGAFSSFDSYPSPPPSLDESPLSSPPLPHMHAMPLPESHVPLTRVSA